MHGQPNIKINTCVRQLYQYVVMEVTAAIWFPVGTLVISFKSQMPRVFKGATFLKVKRQVFLGKEFGLEVNADKTNYMVMSRDQNVGRSQNIKPDNSSFQRLENFKYLGTTLNQNSILEEIKSKLKSGNACYHSVQNILSSSCYREIKILSYTEI
jgi:hypothetical protein